jgi:hypothetical protein
MGKKLVWRVYVMTGGTSGRMAFRKVAEEMSKRKALAHIPANTRNVLRIGRDYSYMGRER